MSKTKLEGVVKKLNTLGIQKKSIASRAGISYMNLINALRGESEIQIDRCYKAIIDAFPDELSRERTSPETTKEVLEKLHNKIADLKAGQDEQTEALAAILGHPPYCDIVIIFIFLNSYKVSVCVPTSYSC